MEYTQQQILTIINSQSSSGHTQTRGAWSGCAYCDGPKKRRVVTYAFMVHESGGNVCLEKGQGVSELGSGSIPNGLLVVLSGGDGVAVGRGGLVGYLK